MPGAAQPIYRTGAWVSGGAGVAARSRRHVLKPKKDNIQGITKPSIRRLARRGGVKRVKIDIYDTVRAGLMSRIKAILEKICRTINCAGPGRALTSSVAESDRVNGRKTITTVDVVWALKELGTPLYGYDWPQYGRAESKKKARRGAN